ncbi:thiamine pyrophosphate-binding protein [Natronorubrum tibetense]|uniref:Thiamine pyrophosphate domain-containing TPP-binding protein n=1 Tax=Natronorubrum tibetense GA33 TaxID=1114856 RepID=L9VPE3_9EURY|nr:thiamine pyrophosphate-binding protein [Natronorubrum tibetense]ELY38931.1 thiamine pyrophosphate domain-containing TPP-binding protein [Natronorubrum tibetense GA33]
MKVNEAIIDCLTENDVDTLFGIPGKQSLPLNESISERDDIQFVMARHETAVSHQAWGYAETSGGMAATVVIPGPGDMNAMNGLKNALNDCTPLLHIAVETEPEIRGGDGIHETPPDTYDNVVKENITVETPQSTVAELQTAIDAAQTAPKGPVRIGIPKNFLKMDVPLAERGEVERQSFSGVPDAKVDAAADLLAEASSPVIIAGGGTRAADASDELRAVAERLEAPVVLTYKGKAVFPDEHELMGGVLCGGTGTAVKELIADSDAALGVGTDFDAVTMQNWSIEVPDELVHVTLGADDIGTGYEPAVGIVADAARTLDELDGALSERSISGANGAERAQATRDAIDERLEELRAVSDAPLTSVKALDAIREGTPRDAVVAVDAGGFRLWTLVMFPTYEPRDYVNPGSWATMGSGVPSAIGAKVANPEQDVVALTGDGGLLMCLHELHTLADEEIDVTVVVLNNSDYAIISEEAGRSYRMDEGEYGWEENPVSYTTVADGLGIDVERAETPDEIEATVADAIASDGPTLVEIPTDPYEPQSGVWMNE